VKLLQAASIGDVRLRNRVVMTPMGMFAIPAPDGSITDRGIAFYSERAKGGTALIFPAATLVTTVHEGPVSSLTALDSLDKSPGWSMLAEELHHYGAKLGVQLCAGLGRINVNYFYDQSHVPVSASAVPAYWTPWISCRPLETGEIEEIVQAFARAALIARNAGADVLEIHGYGGYLMDQFMSSLWNKREDEYGGDLDGRMKFPLEVVAAVRGAVGDSAALVFKFTPVHLVEGGREMEEGLEIARRLEGAGVDALHVDVGCYESWHTAIPPVYSPAGAMLDINARVRAAVSIPVIAHGKLGDPEVAEAALQDGKCDFIGLGRPLLADPCWVDKVARGKPLDITPCIGCSEGCIGRGVVGRYASCAVNPACAMEERYTVEPAVKPKRVLVVGAGPGGLEAATVAAERGHEVTLWEKKSVPGGCLVAASAPPFKKDVGRLLAHMVHRADEAGVKMSLGLEASADEVISGGFDAVIVATGGEPATPDGMKSGAGKVVTAIDVLEGKTPLEGRVVVLGGGVVGCETAAFLAGEGCTVTLVEAEPQLLPGNIFLLNRAGLLELIEKAGVETIVGARPAGVEDGAVLLEDGRRLECDAIVLATGMRPDNSLAQALEGRGLEVHTIGDAASPRNIMEAVWEGFHAARLL
jgi:2-enoate reductase